MPSCEASPEMSLDEKFIGWKCHWMKSILDDSAFYRSNHNPACTNFYFGQSYFGQLKMFSSALANLGQQQTAKKKNEKTTLKQNSKKKHKEKNTIGDVKKKGGKKEEKSGKKWTRVKKNEKEWKNNKNNEKSVKKKWKKEKKWTNKKSGIFFFFENGKKMKKCNAFFSTSSMSWAKAGALPCWMTRGWKQTHVQIVAIELNTDVTQTAERLLWDHVRPDRHNGEEGAFARMHQCATLDVASPTTIACLKHSNFLNTVRRKMNHSTAVHMKPFSTSNVHSWFRFTQKKWKKFCFTSEKKWKKVKKKVKKKSLLKI